MRTFLVCVVMAIIGLFGFFGTATVFHFLALQVVYVPYTNHLIAALLSLATIIAIRVQKPRRHKSAIWLVYVLFGLACGAWMAAWVFGGFVSR